MLQLLVFSSLLALALSVDKCVLPPVPTTAPLQIVPFKREVDPTNGFIKFACPDETYAIGNFGDRLFYVMDKDLFPVDFICNPADGKFTEELKLTTLTCMAVVQPIDTMCVMVLAPSTMTYPIINDSGDVKCPAGQMMKVLGQEATKINCKNNKFYGLLADGGVYDLTNTTVVECVVAPATTTTAAPATTTVKDQNLLSSHLLPLTVYYNFGLGLHAFCSNPTCYSQMQSNGIGYDPSSGSYLMGKVISNDPGIVAAAKTRCPIGWSNMRLLGFQKVGLAYEHNLSGAGLQIGYVSIAANNCGATEPIKKWKSKVNADIMYGINLEGNSWYSGMVQNGGAPFFFIWKSTY